MPEKTLTLVGCGAMGGALLRGWLKASSQAVDRYHVITPRQDSADSFLQDPRVEWDAFLSPEFRLSGVVVFALKPQVLQKVLHEYALLIPHDSLIITIAAGLELSFYQKFFPKNPIIRVMPNTPASVNGGISALYASPNVTPDQRTLAESLFNAVGKTVWVNSDADIDRVTAISGCGPAYFYLLGEMLSKGAQKIGLTPEQGDLLARQTLIGTGAYLDASPKTMSELRQNVTSPGGMTEAALKVLLENNDFATLIEEAVQAAMDRADQLKG